MEPKCGGCGTTRLEKAMLEGTALRLERSSALKKVLNVGGAVFADVCLERGAVSNLRGDPAKLAEMID